MEEIRMDSLKPIAISVWWGPVTDLSDAEIIHLQIGIEISLMAGQLR